MKPEQQEIYHLNPREEYRRFIPAGAISALDVGCGKGGFGLTLRGALGPEAQIVGIDAVPENVQAALATLAFDRVSEGYFPSDFASSQLPKFDLISFMDVLEHMYDPWSVIRTTKSFLGREGRVLAAIPNVQVWTLMRDLARGRWEYTESGILDRTHIRFFTRRSIVEMFEDAGYVVEVCEGMNAKRPALRPLRSLVLDMKWLPLAFPDSRWLHYAVVARPA